MLANAFIGATPRKSLGDVCEFALASQGHDAENR
jgi:glutamate formiminotransferase